MSPSYEAVCQKINQRLQLVFKLECERNDILQKLEAKEKELEKFQRKYYQSKSEEAFKAVAYLFSNRFFHQFRITKNFLSALSQTLEDFSFIKEYILFEVRDCGQQVQSLNLSSKSRTIPRISLEETVTGSYFKSYVAKTCNSITNELFGKNSINFKIEQIPGRIQFVLGVKLESNYVNHIDSSYISRVLSGELQRYTSPNLVKEILKPIHLLFPIAERIKKNIDHRQVIYQVDLGMLTREINSFDEFSWNSFFNDVVIGLNEGMKGEVTIFSDGVRGIFLLADYSTNIDEAALFLQNLMTWSYFNSEESTIGRLIDLSIRRLNLKESCLEKIIGFDGVVNNLSLTSQEEELTNVL